MAITYTTPWPELPGVRVPILYTIKYAETVDYVDAYYQRSYKDHLVDEWLRANCRNQYYHSPGYLKEKSIQFEDDKEAVMFALRWGI
jgi:hypothetical protein